MLPGVASSGPGNGERRPGVMGRRRWLGGPPAPGPSRPALSPRRPLRGFVLKGGRWSGSSSFWRSSCSCSSRCVRGGSRSPRRRVTVAPHRAGRLPEWLGRRPGLSPLEGTWGEHWALVAHRTESDRQLPTTCFGTTSSIEHHGRAYTDHRFGDDKASPARRDERTTTLRLGLRPLNLGGSNSLNGRFDSTTRH
jgi:hypothetical protein